MVLKKITVFMGSQSGDKEIYTKTAESLGQLIAKNNITMVYGGSHDGLMGITARHAMASGGKVIGITPHNLAEEAIDASEINELIEVDGMDSRKELLMAYGEAFIALPGGFGTLEEIAQVISWSKIGLHHKPMLLLNIDGFYDDLWRWLVSCVKTGFVTYNDIKNIIMVDTPEDAMAYLLDNESQVTNDVLEGKV
ncbi:LOG family protein [Leuconostoc palmae]|uniref:LOG family protein n=1 Tax=Leuconostoc palmae TaxID=501487 RepID=UPI001C7D720D|nr:TIGR00730 family Rossman fold protein [Leuconostoc palmae]